ncbi:MAG: DapH/DapD/GlmU-related protein [Candidatus Hodarchaeota archaeon]
MGESESQQNSVIEDEVRLGEGCVVEAFAVLRGRVQTGTRCFFGASCKIQGPAKIGNQVFIGERVIVGFPNQQQIFQFQSGEIDVPWQNTEKTEIGNQCIVRPGSVLYAGIVLGDNVRIGHNVLIREQVKIGNDSMIGTSATIDGNSVIGSKVSIQTNVYIPWRTHIEDNVFLGPHCILTNDKYAMRAPYELHGPIIRKGASIGAGAVILPSVEIGAESVVGAGAVVTKDVPPKTIVYGVPAQVYATVPDSWKIPLE